MRSCVTRTTLFSKGSPLPFLESTPQDPSCCGPLSTQASGHLWLLDFVLLLRLLWENSYSFFKAHQNPSSTRKPFFLPACLPPLLSQGFLLCSRT